MGSLYGSGLIPELVSRCHLARFPVVISGEGTGAAGEDLVGRGAGMAATARGAVCDRD